MNDTNHSSRHSLLDAIELISNQLAISSHLQESIQDMKNTYRDMPDEELAQKIKDLEYLEEESVSIRRRIMKQIEAELEGNPKMWCLFKHACASYGLGSELLQANYDTEHSEFYKKIYTEIYQQTLSIAGLFANLDGLETCARCLGDKLADKKSEDTIFSDII